jgi:hypothetical protein
MKTARDQTMGEHAAHRGDHETALRHFDTERRACLNYHESDPFLILVDAERARSLAALGRLDEARVALEAAQRAQERSQHERFRVRLQVAAAELAAATGDSPRALSLLDAAREFPVAKISPMERARIGLARLAALARSGAVPEPERERFLAEARSAGLRLEERLGREIGTRQPNKS